MSETPTGGDVAAGDPQAAGSASSGQRRNRRRGSRGGRNRKPKPESSNDSGGSSQPKANVRTRKLTVDTVEHSLPAPPPPGPPPQTPPPQIGDSRPAPDRASVDAEAKEAGKDGGKDGAAEPNRTGSRRRRRRGGRGRGGGRPERTTPQPVEAMLVDDSPVELDEEVLELQRGRRRKGRPVGRYLMCVHVAPDATQIAILEGRSLLEHYVARPADDISHIHGNIYLGRVQNVLPGMEAAFIDIGTPKNAVLYRGDVTYDTDDVDESPAAAAPQPPPKQGRRRGRRSKPAPDAPRIEDLLKAKQSILCQVTKNPIGHKGARLTTEVSLPGRHVVLVPGNPSSGISKRLSDSERKRLRSVLDACRPEGHGLIVRTAAENVTRDEIERDVKRLVEQWNQIEQLAKTTKAPAMLFREPELALRVIREEFNRNYRGVIIDDQSMHEQVKGYMQTVTPAQADRIELYVPGPDGLPLFERHHVHEQLHKALDKKVWLPSGGSLIIEHTEALTVIDVNTGKNVGDSNLEETVFQNNLEAAEEIARQLRLRDIGGIIVIDFIDMEIRKNRDEVISVFRASLARDKTRTQVFDISELGLVEMTRKRIGEGLIESFSSSCPQCDGRGIQLDESLLD